MHVKELRKHLVIHTDLRLKIRVAGWWHDNHEARGRKIMWCSLLFRTSVI